MSGFGGFGQSSTSGGLFGNKAADQSSTGFTISTTTAVTTTAGVTFGTPNFSGGTGLFGSQQPTSTFGAGFGTNPAPSGTGIFNFTTSASNAPTTFGVPTTTAPAPTFGFSTTSSAPTSTFGFATTTSASGFTLASSNTSLQKFGSPGTTTSTFGSAPLGFSTPKTTATTGFTIPTSSATTSSSFKLPLTTNSTTPATLSFCMPTTTTAGTANIATTVTTSALTFGVTSGVATTASNQPAGFTLSQPTTTSSLTFGGPKTTKVLTFGTGTSGFNTTAATTTAQTFTLGSSVTTASSLGTSLLGSSKPSETGLGTSSGLGGVDYKQTTQGLSGPGTLEPKHVKDSCLPEAILQTLNEFQNFTKQQKSLSVEISHGSSKPLKKVQEDTEAIESLLTMITSGLTRNAIAVDKLKSETAQGLHQAELAQRNHEAPPGLDYDNSAPSDYFNDLVTKFETDTVRLRVQIEASEKHLRSLTQSSTISPQELTLAMRRLHETLIVLAARVQTLHTSVQSQKEQFKNLRRVYFKDDTNIFENDSDQNLVKKQTMYSLRSLTGPTPFSENPVPGLPFNVDGLAMLTSTTGTTIPVTSSSASWLCPVQRNQNAPLPSSNILSGLQPINQFHKFELSNPPAGNKRTRH